MICKAIPDIREPGQFVQQQPQDGKPSDPSEAHTGTCLMTQAVLSPSEQWKDLKGTLHAKLQ